MDLKRYLLIPAALFCAAFFAVCPAFAQAALDAPDAVNIGKPFTAVFTAPEEGASEVRLVWQGKTAKLAMPDGAAAKALLGTDFKDSKPGAYTLSVLYRGADGAEKKVSRAIRVMPFKYPSENITVAPSKVQPPKELAARIAREAKLGRAAMQSDTPGSAPALPLVRPVPGIYTSVYGKSRYFNGQFRGRHGGVDMRAKEGTPVSAAADGTVAEAGNFYFAGNCLYIDHGAGFVTFYCHMSKLNVKKGAHVKAGETIGLSGKTGRVTGPHLHFSTAWRGKFFDPAPLLEK